MASQDHSKAQDTDEKEKVFFSNFKPNRNHIHQITGIREDEERQWEETSGLKQSKEGGAGNGTV